MISGMGSSKRQPRPDTMQRQRTVPTMLAETHGSGGPLKLCWSLKTSPAIQLRYRINHFEHVQILAQTNNGI